MKMENTSHFNAKSICEKYGISPALLEEWIQEQKDIRSKVILKDTEFWQHQHLEYCSFHCDTEEVEDDEQLICNNETPVTSNDISEVKSTPLKYIAGYDISYIKDDDTTACAALIVCQLPNLEIVYEYIKLVKITTPYIPGFLCFREALPAIDALKQLQEENPELVPQVILIDGNGYLHNRGAGLATYLGIKLDIPTIGIGKNLYFVEDIKNDERHKQQLSKLKETGDNFPLLSKDGTVLGMALKTCSQAKKPVYVSIGHRISIETAVWVVQKASKYRVPEPIRQADIRSRQVLREKYPHKNESAEPSD